MHRVCQLLLALILSLTSAHPVLCQTSNTNNPTNTNVVITDPLVRMLLAKGVLTESEARTISESGTAVEQRDRLANLLRDKGIISAAEYDSVRALTPIGDRVALSAKSTTEGLNNDRREEPATPQSAPTPSVIAAVAPTRLLPIDLPKREGLLPDIKLSTGARLKLYGFFSS